MHSSAQLAQRGLSARVVSSEAAYCSLDQSPPATRKKAGSQSFELVRTHDGGMSIVSDDETIRLRIGPLTFTDTVNGSFCVINWGAGAPDRLFMAPMSFPALARTNLDMCIQNSCRSYFPTYTFYEYPKFTHRLAQGPGVVCLMVGYGIHYPLRGNCPRESGSSSLESRYMELIVPSEYSRREGDPCSIHLYSDHLKSDLVTSITIGCPGNRARVIKGLGQTGDSHLPATTISVGDHALSFRNTHEADLWRVVIDDLMAASETRWRELTRGVQGEAPKGYRTHLSRLFADLMDTKVVPEVELLEDVPPQTRLIQNSLTCIDYLSTRLNECKCLSTVDLKFQDLVYETRHQLIKSLNLSSS